MITTKGVEPVQFQSRDEVHAWAMFAAAATSAGNPDPAKYADAMMAELRARDAGEAEYYAEEPSEEQIREALAGAEVEIDEEPEG